MVKYVKQLGGLPEGILGGYDEYGKYGGYEIRVDFNYGLLWGTIATFHEFYHYIVNSIWLAIWWTARSKRLYEFLMFLDNFIHWLPFNAGLSLSSAKSTAGCG